MTQIQNLPPEASAIGSPVTIYASAGGEGAITGYKQHGRTALRWWFGGVGLIIVGLLFQNFVLAAPAVIIVPIAVYASVRWLLGYTTRNLGVQRVLVGPQGLVIEGPQQNETCLWQDTVAVWEDVKSVEKLAGGSVLQYKYVIERTDGRRFVFTEALQNVDKLGWMLKQHILPQRLLAARAQLDAGETVWFDKLGIRQDGFIKDEEVLPWTEVKQFVVTSQFIAVHKQGRLRPWLVQKTARVPNLDLLLTLLQPMSVKIQRQ